MFRSHKSCFGFEDSEEIPSKNKNFSWRDITLSKRLGIFLLQKSALESNFTFTDNLNTSTVIINYFSNYYCGEKLEIHLTAVKTFDLWNSDVLQDIHLTLRNTSSQPKNHSFYYNLQHSKIQDFRFVRSKFVESNQNDDMNEFLGQQGPYNFSSAVLQPILFTLYSLNHAQKLYIENRCLKLQN